MDQKQYTNVSNLGERFWLLILFEAALGNEFKGIFWYQKSVFMVVFFAFNIMFNHMGFHIPNIGSLAHSQTVLIAAEHKSGHKHSSYYLSSSNMLCKTGSSILAQGVMENIAQSATPQHSIKSKADTVPTIG